MEDTSPAGGGALGWQQAMVGQQQKGRRRGRDVSVWHFTIQKKSGRQKKSLVGQCGTTKIRNTYRVVKYKSLFDISVVK